MGERMLSGYQALQLLALGPCIFMFFFLCVTSRKPSQVIVPILFFFSLACSFCLPLLGAFGVINGAKGILLMGESLTSALIFLLVVQFVSGGMPSLIYWSILAVPLVGGSTLAYAAVLSDAETCVWGNICLDSKQFRSLYGVFSAALTLLLTVLVFHRMERVSNHNVTLQKTTNALVFALIMLNALLLGIELLSISGGVTSERADFAITVVRIGFIYLALTSIFRVFDRSFEIDFERVPTLRPAEPTDREQELARKVRALMVQDKLYRTMDINREKLAKTLAVTEQTLSRAVNMCFGQSISAVINQYRVEEAEGRLVQEKTAITIIAFEVGFSSIPSFNRVFKQATGMSPSSYRVAKQQQGA